MLLAMLHRCLVPIGMIGCHVSRRDYKAGAGQQSQWHCTFQVRLICKNLVTLKSQCQSLLARPLHGMPLLHINNNPRVLDKACHNEVQNICAL